MKFRLNITPKLTLIFVLFAALLLAVVSTLAYTSGRASLQTAAVSELLSAAIDKQAALDAWMGEAQVHASAIESSPYLQESLADLRAAQRQSDKAEAQIAHDRLVSELQVWAGEGRDYLGWMIMDPDSSQIIAATDASEEGKYRDDQAYFVNGKSGPYVQNVYFSLAAQGTLLTVSGPIRAADGEVLGVLAGNLDLGKMNEIVSRRTGLRQSDDAYLVNASELFVTQPRSLSDPAVLRLGVHTEAVRRCLAHNSGVSTAPDYRGIMAMIVYRWLPERQLCLMVKMDQAEALAPVNTLGRNILIISGLALLTASALAFWLARTITRPIHQLAKGAAEIGRGNLEYRIAMPAEDEIGQLGGAFDQMTEDLQKTLVSRDNLLREVAERKRMEEALAESEKKLRALFETMSEGIVYEDHDGKIISANPAAERLLGLSLDQMQGRTSLDPRWKAIHEDGSPFPGETHSLRVAAMTGKPGHDEIQGIYNPQLGAYTWLSINSTPEFLPGEKTPFRAYAVFRDISERKQAEEALQKTTADLERSNRELEQFAYIASHDLQEPLRMVSSYTQLLAKRYSDQLDQDAHDFIAYAVDGANRMQKLIQDLLTYSRVATQGRPYEPVDLHEPLGEAIANLETAIDESGALITTGDLPTVSGDRTQFVQVFQNLIGNAIKFRKKEEPPRVHISARRQGTEWILSVKDNGMGIDPQHFRRLFVIFQRLHGSQEYAGTGIGLALCRRIIARHGGRIWVESAPGQGSEFFFALTADRPPSPSRGAVS